MKLHWLLLLVLVVTPCVVERARGQTTEEQFVDGLVARRLFPLAELACRTQLSDQTLSRREQAAWTVELMRIVAQHATHSLPSQRAARWQAAHQVAQEFLTNNSDHPRRILVDLQEALTYLAEGELARLEADIAAEPHEAFERARDTVREAARQLESIDKQLATLMTGAGGRGGDPDLLTADELFSLQNNVRFQLARALRNQGLSYPAGSNDRVIALAKAIKQLNTTLTQLRAGDSLTWQVYLDLATCHRLLEDLEQAQRALATLLAETAPLPVRLKANAELARIMIAADRAEQALDQLSRARVDLQVTSPDLDFARLEAMLLLWKSASTRKDEVMAGQWQKQVSKAVALMEQTHGAYWGRRAKLGQLAVADTGMAAGDIEILASSADELYKKKQFDEAIKTYERAAELARTAGDLQQASDVEYKAALIEQKLKRHDAASRRLQRLASEQPSHPQASSKHLLAIWNLAQQPSSDPTVPDRCRDLLEQHLERWATEETANTAREWLGDLCRSQRDWESAVNAYRTITPDSQFFPKAVQRLGICWDKLLRARQLAGLPIEGDLAKATGFLDGVILGRARNWPERWSEAQLHAALATARLRLDYASDGLVDVQRVLQAAIPQAPVDDEAWLQEARSLLVVALAGQAGNEQEALRLLQQLGSGSVEHLLQLIDSLSKVAENSAPPVRSQISQVQLAALDQLDTGAAQLSSTQKVQVDQVRAEALRIAGRVAESLAVYRRLADEQPNNGSVQLKLADMLLQSDDEPTLSEAITQWQKVARRIRPNTDDWLRARYNIALALYKRNRPQRDDHPADRAVAAQRLKYLKATSNVDSTPWKAKVDELLQRCE